MAIRVRLVGVVGGLLMAACATRHAQPSNTAREAASITAEPSVVAPKPAAPAARVSPNAPDYPPEEIFVAHPFVREGKPRPDGSFDATVHPWVFLGSLHAGTGDCDANETFSFASVKDMSQRARVVRDLGVPPTCKHEVRESETASGWFVDWGASCVFDAPAAHVLSVQRIEVSAAPVARNQHGEWLHDAQFVETVSVEGEQQLHCEYVGFVARRTAK